MKDSKIIIKKVKKIESGGHHGGSWKVAYADFVTAMMAFFLLLWLITMVAPEKRARVAAYFKYFSLFEKGGSSFMDKTSAIFDESGESADKAFAPNYYGNNTSAMTPETLQEAIRNAVETMLGDIKEQVMVRVVKEGVKIDIVDKNGSSMFAMGSADLTGRAKKILKVLENNLSEISNKLYIEGHTDSFSFSYRNNYGNWELSTERANAARRYLEDTGISPQRIVRIIGYADKDPLLIKKPRDPRNRRISIVVLFPEKTRAPNRKTRERRPSSE